MTDDALRWMEAHAAELRAQQRDLLDVGKAAKPPGRREGKLTAEQVREVRAARGKVSSTALARELGVHSSVVCQIWKGTTYRWVE